MQLLRRQPWQKGQAIYFSYPKAAIFRFAGRNCSLFRILQRWIFCSCSALVSRNSGNLEGSETVTLRKFPLIWSQALSKSHLQLAHSHNYATANSARGYFSEGEESRRNWPPDSRKGQAKRRRKEWSQLSNLGLVLVESAFLLFFLVANDIPESRSRRKKSVLGLEQTQLARFPFLVISWQQELEIYSDFHLQYRGKI